MTTEMTPAMRRSALISLLRDKSMWPKGFLWNFYECQQCAMGLFWEALGGKDERDFCAAQLGLPFGLARDIFCCGYPNANNNMPTPSEVADKLEAVHNRIMAQAR